MKNLLFSVCILWASLSGLAYGQCTYYTLQNGETMSSISNGDGNLFMGLINSNPTINFNTATTGTSVCIPTASYSSYKLTGSTASTCTYYTVKSGDTFSTLSNNNAALISALQSANPYVNGYALTAGSTICIPTSLYSSYNFNSYATSCTYYTVKSGDTFATLSNNNAALISSLQSANPSVNGYSMAVGSTICIPTSLYSSYNFNSYATSCTYYTIKSGDTYYSLSNGNSALISALTAANPTVNSGALTVGQTVCIPNAFYSSYNFNTAVATTCSSYYTIKSGDTFYSLSNGNSALISALTAANPSVNPSALAVGQSICIPTTSAGSYNTYSGYASGCASYYTIKSGDTFSSISNGNSALVSALVAANPSVNPSALAVGQSICIPSSSAGSYNTYSSGTSTGCTYYTIKSGNTYYSLSNGNQALITALTNANPSVNPSALAVGQSICVPTSSYSSYALY